MVINSAQECNEIVKSFFKENLPCFSLNVEWVHAPYWHIEFAYDSIKIEIDGDMGYNIYIYIYDTRYSLWQYDKSVNNCVTSTEENILYQLQVLKRFIDEIGY